MRDAEEEDLLIPMPIILIPIGCADFMVLEDMVFIDLEDELVATVGARVGAGVGVLVGPSLGMLDWEGKTDGKSDSEGNADGTADSDGKSDVEGVEDGNCDVDGKRETDGNTEMEGMPEGMADAATVGDSLGAIVGAGVGAGVGLILDFIDFFVFPDFMPIMRMPIADFDELLSMPMPIMPLWVMTGWAFIMPLKSRVARIVSDASTESKLKARRKKVVNFMMDSISGLRRVICQMLWCSCLERKKGSVRQRFELPEQASTWPNG
jgi:hypothetical protein